MGNEKYLVIAIISVLLGLVGCISNTFLHEPTLITLSIICVLISVYGFSKFFKWI